VHVQGFSARRPINKLRGMRVRILALAAVTYLTATATASADLPHVVTAGESLSSVAAADGVSVDQLAAANGLSTGAQLVAGSTLMIPRRGSGSSGGDAGSGASGVAAGSGAASGDQYVVQAGDTLSGIAASAGISVSELASANGLDPSGVLRAGSVLNLTGSRGGTSSGDAGSASSQPVGTTAEGSSAGPPYPTAEHVSSSQVGSIASDNGVSPSLAEAIGWQESGFNNDLVSSADARGVMQILPGTWDWIQRTLVPGGAPLDPASATDNVRGGVLMLRSLLNSTGGDPAMAAAGYYQGLPSVEQNGVYPDTQQYIDSVMALRQRFGGG
jgi:LysM repeat protein